MIKTLSQLYNLTNHPVVLYPWFFVTKQLHNLMKCGKVRPHAANARPHAATRGLTRSWRGLTRPHAAKARPHVASRGLTRPRPYPSRPPYLLHSFKFTLVIKSHLCGYCLYHFLILYACVHEVSFPDQKTTVNGLEARLVMASGQYAWLAP